MDFFKKIRFFSFGLLMGIFFLVIILNGKKMSCNYGPESRVINNLKQKKWIFDDEIIALDSINLVDFLENSVVVFSKSNTRKDSCKVYYLNGFVKNKKIAVEAENCFKIVKAKLIKN